jgi:hypothetical protein
VHIRREKRNTQEANTLGKRVGGGQTQNIDAWCMKRMYAPNNEDVCENIEHKKHEYREEIGAELRERSAIEDVRALEML